MKIKTITEALRWFRQENHRRVVSVTDSMSTLHKVQNEYLYADWMDIILKGPFDQITWIFSPGHAGIVGNERADVIAGAAVIDNNLTFDQPTVLQFIQNHLALNRTKSSYYTLTLVKEIKEFRPDMAPTTPAEEQRGIDRTSSCLKPSAYLH